MNERGPKKDTKKAEREKTSSLELKACILVRRLQGHTKPEDIIREIGDITVQGAVILLENALKNHKLRRYEVIEAEDLGTFEPGKKVRVSVLEIISHLKSLNQDRYLIDRTPPEGMEELTGSVDPKEVEEFEALLKKYRRDGDWDSYREGIKKFRRKDGKKDTIH